MLQFVKGTRSSQSQPSPADTNRPAVGDTEKRLTLVAAGKKISMITVTTTDPGAMTRRRCEAGAGNTITAVQAVVTFVVRELPASCPMCCATVWELARTNPPLSDDTFTPTY